MTAPNDTIRIPDITDVLKARKALRGLVRHTPLEYSHPLSDLTGARVYLKLENQQHANSFKIRGAINKMLSMSEEERARGVITASSGNHAQGLASAAALVKTRAVICVPEICPETKQASVRARGGEWADLRVVGPQYEDTERAALRMAEEEGLTFVSAFEDTHIAAGQGTLALEMLEDEPELDVIISPLSGGGLLTGIAVAARALRPGIALWGTMAENNQSWQHAWKVGRVEPIAEIDSLADALGGAASQKLYPFIRQALTGIRQASEDEIGRWMAWMHKHHHMVIEGASATSVAALASGEIDVAGKRVGVVVSGGNVDEATMLQVMQAYRET